MAGNFVSSAANAAIWRIRESDTQLMTCTWQGWNLWNRFHGFMRVAFGAGIFGSTTPEIDDLSTGISWKTITFLMRLVDTVPHYQLSRNHPVTVALSHALFATLPGSTEEQRRTFPLTDDDRRLITSYIIWLTLYAPTPSSFESGWRQWLIENSLGLQSRDGTFRFDQIILDNDAIPLPIPGTPDTPASGAPANPTCTRNTSNPQGQGQGQSRDMVVAPDRTGYYVAGAAVVAAAIGAGVWFYTHHKKIM